MLKGLVNISAIAETAVRGAMTMADNGNTRSLTINGKGLIDLSGLFVAPAVASYLSTHSRQDIDRIGKTIRHDATQDQVSSPITLVSGPWTLCFYVCVHEQMFR